MTQQPWFLCWSSQVLLCGSCGVDFTTSLSHSLLQILGQLFGCGFKIFKIIGQNRSTNANMMNYWLNSPASCHPHISWGHSYGRFFEQAAINICSGSIPKREFTKPAANRQTDSPKHRTPRYFGVPVPKPASWNPAPRPPKVTPKP